MTIRLLHRARHALMDLVDIRLALLIGLLALLLAGVAQVPLRYPIIVGQEDGPGADLPLVGRFYGASSGPNGRYRWSGARSTVQLPGFTERQLLLTIDLLPLPQDVFDSGQHQAALWASGQLIAPLLLRPTGAHYHVLLPPLSAANPTIEFRSTTFRATGDERDLGIAVGALLIQRMSSAAPAWPAGLLWVLLPVLLWAGLRWSGFQARFTTLFCAIASLLVASAVMLDPPRATLAAAPLLSALALAVGLCILFHTALPALFAHVGQRLSARALRWLLLFVLLTFTVRYGGKIVPGSMPGDIGFHDHRFAELITGQIFLQAPHRGVLSPYPSALYLILAPFHLIGINLRPLLHVSAALFDAISPLIVYLIAVIGFGQRSRHETPALLAAGVYTLAPGGMLASWWNFSTHIFAQTIHLCLIATIMLIFQHQRQTDPPARSSFWPTGLAILLLLECLVYLSHFSYYLNASLLLGSATALLIALALLRIVRRQIAQSVTLISLAGQIIVFSLFYSFYLGTISTQVGTVGAASEDTALDNSQALWLLIQSLLGEGLRDHTGLFPALLALVGIVVGLTTMRRHMRHAAMPALLVLSGLTLLIALGFALLPLFSSANLTTRWLMFSLWAIAVWSAPAALRYWRRGRAGRLMVMLIGAYLFWVSAAIWLLALAWRVRPPEPF